MATLGSAPGGNGGGRWGDDPNKKKLAPKSGKIKI